MTMHTASSGMVFAGRVVSGLLILFLLFDGGTKVLKVVPVLEACERLGHGANALVGIGAVLLVCTALYAVPQTAVLGAILLTAFLGGAVAIHVRAGSGWFEIAFAIGFGALAWLGIVLREPRLLWIVVGRSPTP